MGRRKSCPNGGVTKDNGNCTFPGPDNLPVQCVGPWAKDKHNYVRRFIDASRGARQKFLRPPKRGGDPAGAGYIELFAGPGKARIRSNGTIVDGSPLLATAYTRVPFTRLVFADKESENIDALKMRLKGNDHAEMFCGDCNDVIDEMVRLLPPRGLNLAFVDPFGLKPLSFETLGKLAALKRMDMIIHFPTMDVRRNFKQDYARTESLQGSWALTSGRAASTSRTQCL